MAIPTGKFLIYRELKDNKNSKKLQKNIAGIEYFLPIIG
jgi:hypothetical protein